MSLVFRPYDPAHALALRLQPSQAIEAGQAFAGLTAEGATLLGEQGAAWSALDGDRVVCCAGLAESFPGRQATAWAMLAAGIGPLHLALTRFAAARIAESPLRRIEAVVADDARCTLWATLCGLRREATLACWGGASETVHIFARVR